jgi:hypothetical protein
VHAADVEKLVPGGDVAGIRQPAGTHSKLYPYAVLLFIGRLGS